MRFFITGISRGLGRALAEQCSLRGHEVWGVSRSENPGLPGGIHYRKCDISYNEDVIEAFSEIIVSGYIPDVVILNAASLENDFHDGLDFDVFKKTFEVNLLGNARWVGLLLPYLSGKKCFFVNISSLASFRAMVRHKVAYPASKSAMDMVFEGLRLQCEKPGVKFVTVNIGPMGGKRSVPLLTTTYEKAAGKIIDFVETGSPKNKLCFPTCAALIFRTAKLFPDSILKKITGLRR